MLLSPLRKSQNQSKSILFHRVTLLRKPWASAKIDNFSYGYSFSKTRKVSQNRWLFIGLSLYENLKITHNRCFFIGLALFENLKNELFVRYFPKIASAFLIILQIKISPKRFISDSNHQIVTVSVLMCFCHPFT